MNGQRGSNADRSGSALSLTNVDALVGRCGLLNPKFAVFNASPASRKLPVLAVPHDGGAGVPTDLAVQDGVVAGDDRDVIGLSDEVRLDWNIGSIYFYRFVYKNHV